MSFPHGRGLWVADGFVNGSVYNIPAGDATALGTWAHCLGFDWVAVEDTPGNRAGAGSSGWLAAIKAAGVPQAGIWWGSQFSNETYAAALSYWGPDFFIAQIEDSGQYNGFDAAGFVAAYPSMARAIVADGWLGSPGGTGFNYTANGGGNTLSRLGFACMPECYNSLNTATGQPVYDQTGQAYRDGWRFDQIFPVLGGGGLTAVELALVLSELSGWGDNSADRSSWSWWDVETGSDSTWQQIAAAGYVNDPTTCTPTGVGQTPPPPPPGGPVPMTATWGPILVTWPDGCFGETVIDWSVSFSRNGRTIPQDERFIAIPWSDATGRNPAALLWPYAADYPLPPSPDVIGSFGSAWDWPYGSTNARWQGYGCYAFRVLIDGGAHGDFLIPTTWPGAHSSPQIGPGPATTLVLTPAQTLAIDWTLPHTVQIVAYFEDMPPYMTMFAPKDYSLGAEMGICEEFCTPVGRLGWGFDLCQIIFDQPPGQNPNYPCFQNPTINTDLYTVQCTWRLFRRNYFPTGYTAPGSFGPFGSSIPVTPVCTGTEVWFFPPGGAPNYYDGDIEKRSSPVDTFQCTSTCMSEDGDGSSALAQVGEHVYGNVSLSTTYETHTIKFTADSTSIGPLIALPGSNTSPQQTQYASAVLWVPSDLYAIMKFNDLGEYVPFPVTAIILDPTAGGPSEGAGARPDFSVYLQKNAPFDATGPLVLQSYITTPESGIFNPPPLVIAPDTPICIEMSATVPNPALPDQWTFSVKLGSAARYTSTVSFYAASAIHGPPTWVGFGDAWSEGSTFLTDLGLFSWYMDNLWSCLTPQSCHPAGADRVHISRSWRAQS